MLIARLLQPRPAQKPGAVLTWVLVLGAAWDFCPESAFSADSLTVSVQSPCVIACFSICAHDKNPKHWQPLLLFAQTEILHTPIGMSRAAPVAAVPYPDTRRPEFPVMDNKVLEKGKEITPVFYPAQ